VSPRHICTTCILVSAEMKCIVLMIVVNTGINNYILCFKGCEFLAHLYHLHTSVSCYEVHCSDDCFDSTGSRCHTRHVNSDDPFFVVTLFSRCDSWCLTQFHNNTDIFTSCPNRLRISILKEKEGTRCSRAVCDLYYAVDR
jgi:hypothetical protein